MKMIFNGAELSIWWRLLVSFCFAYGFTQMVCIIIKSIYQLFKKLKNK